MWILFLILLCGVAQAEEVVFYDKNTKEVLFIDEEKMVTLSEADITRVSTAPIPDKFSKEELNRPLSDYKFDKGRVVLNSKKIADKEKEQVEQAKIEERENSARETAKEKLIGLNFTEDEVKVLLK